MLMSGNQGAIKGHGTLGLYASRLGPSQTMYATFGHFLLGSHNFMVTALGSCVKWPLRS